MRSDFCSPPHTAQGTSQHEISGICCRAIEHASPRGQKRCKGCKASGLITSGVERDKAPAIITYLGGEEGEGTSGDNYLGSVEGRGRAGTVLPSFESTELSCYLT